MLENLTQQTWGRDQISELCTKDLNVPVQLGASDGPVGEATNGLRVGSHFPKGPQLSGQAEPFFQQQEMNCL